MLVWPPWPFQRQSKMGRKMRKKKKTKQNTGGEGCVVSFRLFYLCEACEVEVAFGFGGF